VSFTAEDLRAQLQSLGERKATIDTDDHVLTAEIRSAVKDADGVVSMTEVATLLGIHRTTLYRVYRP
jgi:transcriptional regulator of acetoin/glycerol metabolism